MDKTSWTYSKIFKLKLAKKILAQYNRHRVEIYALCARNTVCPGNSDPCYVVTYYIKWVTTSGTHSTAWILHVSPYFWLQNAALRNTL